MTLTRDDLIESFVMEVADQLQLLEDALLDLEQSPGDPSLFAEMCRAGNALKGNAHVVQLATIESFTDTLEEVLDKLRIGAIPASAELVILLLRVVDTFRRVIPRVLDGHDDPQPVHEELVDWIARATHA